MTNKFPIWMLKKAIQQAKTPLMDFFSILLGRGFTHAE